MAKVKTEWTEKGFMQMRKIGYDTWKVSWPHATQHDTSYEKQFSGLGSYNKARSFYAKIKKGEVADN
tara:strand:- start:381 stop:581 length:201 start_codon:yes stop_codon:yes gene_type:complete